MTFNGEHIIEWTSICVLVSIFQGFFSLYLSICLSVCPLVFLVFNYLFFLPHARYFA